MWIQCFAILPSNYAILYTTKSPAVARIPDRTVISDLQGHPRSMIFISSEKAYETFY